MISALLTALVDKIALILLIANGLIVMKIYFFWSSRSWKNPNDFNSSEIQIGYGAGLRVFWGKDFIISIDFGFWEEESGLYVRFDQQF